MDVDTIYTPKLKKKKNFCFNLFFIFFILFLFYFIFILFLFYEKLGFNGGPSTYQFKMVTNNVIKVACSKDFSIIQKSKFHFIKIK